MSAAKTTKPAYLGPGEVYRRHSNSAWRIVVGVTTSIFDVHRVDITFVRPNGSLGKDSFFFNVSVEVAE